MMTSKPARPSFSSSASALLAVPYSVTPGESRNFDLTTSSQNISTGSTSDPAYLYSQLKSAEWIRRYGLKAEKLTFDQILQQIGFKRVEGFDPVIGKTVSAKYAGNLYHEVQHDNGDRYVLTCRPEKLREYHHRLMRMLNLLRKRTLFITNGSRRLFGIIGEPSVCLICDCKTFDHRVFNQFQLALSSLFKEQISKIKRFNIIWVSNDNEQFREQPIDASPSNIDQAIDWICDRKCPKNKISISSTCEAVLKAYNNNAHSIYLISEGDSSDYAREMLRDNIVKTRLASASPIPLHVISLFSHNNDTQTFLRSIAQNADGSYFCYKIRNEVSDLKAPSNLNDPTRIKLQDDKLQIGTNALTPLPEYPLDITIMYKEVIECQSVIDRIEKILGFVRDEHQSSSQAFDTTKSVDGFNNSGENNFQRSMVVQSSALFGGEENDMASADWLKIFGIDAQKLDFFSVLQSAAFRHCDGVVTVLKPPLDSNEVTPETPANPQDKLINAKYCDQFAHVAWPDGTIRHVHVTPELHRDYERRIRALLEKIKARLKWLKKGSRDVFGTVLESNIYILIDTSKSMEHHLGFVKEKLCLLIQDQLFAKERINMVAFNSKINPWRDRLTKINDSNTFSQLQPWIDGLTAEGSTNTLAALRFALADPATEAIYLLSDGRPDQNERHILSQVQYRQIVPIHTIAFNCQDQAANQFLYDLAKQTGGRFHTFKYGFEKETAVEIPESEDVGNLKREFERGQKELERISSLRDECLGRAWSRDNLKGKSSKYNFRATSNNSVAPHLKSNSTQDLASRPVTTSMSQRIKKKKRPANPTCYRRSKSATVIYDKRNAINLDPNQWLLPETKEYLTGHVPKSNTEEEDEIEPEPTDTKKPPAPSDEVKSYLKKNSLLVKGLTIFDVLYPTSVTARQPHHVQFINRSVMEKIWDRLLPLAYGPFIGKLRLVNHYAVDLEKYEVDLRGLIKNYYQFTATFIWKHLSDDDKQKLGATIHWNRLLKDEQDRIIQEITKEEYTSRTALEIFAWRKLSDDERNDLIQNPPPYEDDNQTLLKDALKDAKLVSVLKGVACMDVEIKRALDFLQISTDLRQLQRPADLVSKPKTPPKLKPPGNISIHIHIGQRIICQYVDGFFYPGKIIKGHNGVLIVLFDMGVQQEVAGHTILPINGAIAQPHLFVNDYVLVRQMNQHRESWVPGIVIILPSPCARMPSWYTVRIYTPSAHDVHVPRRDLLKISLGIFQRTVLFLRNMDNPPIITVPPPPPPGGSQTSIEEMITRAIQPLTIKIEKLHSSHMRRYYKLKKTLEIQMIAIRELQEKRRIDPGPDKPSHTPPSGSRKTTEAIITAEIQLNTDPRIIIDPRITTESSSIPSDFIPPNTKVYAVRFDDYENTLAYAGTVIEHQIDSNKYVVRRDHSPKNSSLISRDDIYLRDEYEPLQRLSLRSCALIEYPKDSRQCWSPAVILEHDSDKSQVHVRFYDGIDVYLPNNEPAIRIKNSKFEDYSKSRINYEQKLCGQVVVGLQNETQTYLLGKITSRINSGHEYLIHWCDNTETQQMEEHLFGAFTQPNRHELGDRVLALDNEQCIYKPAKIIGHSNDWKMLTVQYTDDEGDKQDDVNADTTFTITERYYRSFIKK